MLRLKVSTTVIPKSRVADFEMKVGQKFIFEDLKQEWKEENFNASMRTISR